MKLNFWTATTLVFLFLFLWQWNCRGKKCPDVVKKDVTEKVNQTTSVEHPVPKTEIHNPVPERIPVYVRVPVQVPGKTEFIYRTDTFYKSIDTAEILKDYYTARNYEEDFFIDSVKYKNIKGKATVFSTVGENQLNFQNVHFDFEVKTTQVTVQKQRNQVYLGLEGLANQQKDFGAGADLYLKTKGNKMFGAGVQKINGLPPFVKAGFKMILSFR